MILGKSNAYGIFNAWDLLCLSLTLLAISQGRARLSFVESSEKSEAHQGERDERVPQRGLAPSWDHISKENVISCFIQWNK